MPAIYTDQFYTMDPYAPPPGGTAVTFSRLDMTDQNDDGDIDQFDNDTVDGQDVLSSWPGDTVTIRIPSMGVVTYVGTTFYLADGRQVFTPTDGQILYDGRLISATGVVVQGPLNVPADLGPTCFTRGVLIETVDGPRAIEDLREGDLILTRDNGAKPLVWIGHQSFSATGVNSPVLIKKGALGNDADLLVSQQHRMLISDWRAELYMGDDEVLVAAKHLVNGDTIRIIEGGEVEYFHLLFAGHEIVTAAGIPSESYVPAHAVTQDDRNIQAELLQLFPETSGEQSFDWNAARSVARGYEACLMAA